MTWPGSERRTKEPKAAKGYTPGYIRQISGWHRFQAARVTLLIWPIGALAQDREPERIGWARLDEEGLEKRPLGYSSKTLRTNLGRQPSRRPDRITNWNG
jgi:hypothetical protein